MITNAVFRGAVIVAAVALTAAFALSGNTLLASVAAGMGTLWLVIDHQIGSAFGVLFFLVDTSLAVAAGLSGNDALLAVLGLCAALAAWDLSRFRGRLAEAPARERQGLERAHLKLLAGVVGAGMVGALLPLAVHLSLSFVLVCVVTLLAVLALYRSIGAPRAE